MAVYRDGVRVGNFDIRVGLEKARMQAIIKALTGIGPDKPKVPDNKGAMDTIRAMVAKQEGFLKPSRFKLMFNPPKGIPDSETDKATPKGVEKEAAILNQSQTKHFQKTWKSLSTGVGNPYSWADGSQFNKIGMMCNKVSIPEKNIEFGLLRQYGASYPYPQRVQYGTLTTSFYADGAMELKNFFDQWQNLIWNPMTGNFNYYNEYTSSFDVFSLHRIGSSKRDTADTGLGSKYAWANEAAKQIKEASKWVDEKLGGGPARIDENDQFNPDRRYNLLSQPVTNYGVRIHNCFPAIVGEISFDHSATDQIGMFDVTWAYSKWVGFGFSGLSRSGQINLSIGELRMEKDGLPFIEDLPLGLDGVGRDIIDQGITTAPIGKLTGGNVMF